MGWANIFHYEFSPFCQKVLKHYFPNAQSYEDITKIDFSIHKESIDVLTGGFPCQPYSLTGKRLGKEDERYLWPGMLRAIREIRPRWSCHNNPSPNQGKTLFYGGVTQKDFTLKGRLLYQGNRIEDLL